jgi:lipopolysaccharide transport system ATP-binding protein
MDEVSKGEGRTVLFVSHNMAAVRNLCKSAILLKNGEVCNSGSTEFVINYFQQDIKDRGVYKRFENLSYFKVRFNFVELELIQDNNTLISQKLNIKIAVFENDNVNYSLEFIIRDMNGNPLIFSPIGFLTNRRIQGIPGFTRQILISIDLPILANGAYFLDAMLVNPGVEFYHFLENAAIFNIDNSIIAQTGWQFNQAKNQGVVLSLAALTEINYLTI